MNDPNQPPAQQPQQGQPMQQPPQAQQAQQNASVVQGNQKKSGGCFKWVLGCGCLSVILLMLIGLGGGAFLYFQAPKAVGADSWGETFQFLENTQRLAGGAASAGGAVGGEPADLNRLATSDDPEEREQFNQAVDGFNQFFDTLGETQVSQRDMTSVKSQLESWDDSREARNFDQTLERLKALEEAEDSPMNGIRMLRSGVQLLFRANDLGLAYRDYLDDMSPAERDQYHQVNAIARLSRFSADGDHEPWDQAVADALLNDHDENFEKYNESRRLYREIQENPDFDPEELSEEDQRLLSEAFSNQFLMITSAINRDSLEAWASMPEEDRRQIVETSEKPHSLVARIMAGTVHAREDEQGLIYLRMIGF